MNNKKCRFEFRYEQKLLFQLRRVSKKLKITKSSLIRKALFEASEYYSCGMFHFRGQSDFLTRESTSDKSRFEAVFNEDERSMLRKLAYTWKISQAEVLRIVVEYFVYVIHCEDEKNVNFYLKKIRYTHPVAAPLLVAFDIVNVIQAQYHMFRPPGKWQMLIT